jgi:hypothetical protein
MFRSCGTSSCVKIHDVKNTDKMRGDAAGYARTKAVGSRTLFVIAFVRCSIH